MRAAPPVSVRCSGGLPWRALQTVLVAWSAAAFGLWCLQRFEQPWAWAAAAGIAAGLLAWRLARPRPVDLVWNGQHWSANGRAGRLDVVFDIGPCMLLRLKAEQGRTVCWIPLTRAEVGGAMQALRAAAYSRVPSPAAVPANDR